MAVGGNRCGCSAYALLLVDGQQDRGYNAIHRTRTLLAMKAGRQLAAELYPDTHQLQCISLDYAIMLSWNNTIFIATGLFQVLYTNAMGV